jgi:glycosyltransferase involved in cell wall biosynthesis
MLRRLALGVLSKAFAWVDRRAWHHYRRVFAISQEVKHRIIKAGLCDESKIEILHPGIDVGRLQAGGTYNPNFVIPGRIMWTKNIELGIDAFLAFRTKRPDLHFTLTIAGFVDEKSKPYVAELRRRTAGLPEVRFVESPSDEELFELCASAYCILYTPFNEDWGLVPLEAMAMGKPVIAVNRGGPLETVRHTETGFLVEPTASAFAAAMELLADNPSLSRIMGTAATTCVERFDWKHFVAVLDDYLETMRNFETAPLSKTAAPSEAVCDA